MRTIILLILFALILSACSAPHSDARLDKIAASIDSIPESALKALAEINRDSLPEADRHYLDLLTIKAADKAYVDHESDSLILDVINYYSSHEKDLYPEALYYAGRVYSDLGDFPTALKHFHDALDRLHDTDDQLDMRRRVNSQIGRLLNTLSLFDEAIPYIEESISIGKQTKDTISTIHNLQLLANTYFRNREYQKSEAYYKDAISFGNNAAYHHIAKSRLYIAINKLYLNEIDSALYYIQNTIDSVDPTVRNNALLFASTIYLKAGILDSAYMYAQEIIQSKKLLNKDFAYKIILSPELKHYSDLNTREQYFDEYRSLLDSYYNSNQMQLALNQQNLYNYQQHVKAKDEAEASRDRFKNVLAVSFLLIVILIFLALVFRNRNQKRIIELHEALDNIKDLKMKLNSQKTNEHLEKEQHNTKESIESESQTLESKEHDLREQIKKELLSLYTNVDIDKSVSMTILQSNAYQKLQNRINENGELKEEDTLWAEIEETILKSSPDFNKRIMILSLGKLSNTELRTAMLIKFGIKPTQIANLMGRSPATIGSRREVLCQKFLDEKLGPKVIDAVIRIL